MKVNKIKYTKQTSRFAAAILVVAVFCCIPATVSAEEITPDPSSYEYGSTSEFSAYSELNVVADASDSSGSDSSENLADTGINSSHISALAVLFIVSGGAVIATKRYAHA